jgi:hypothetical protein
MTFGRPRTPDGAAGPADRGSWGAVWLSRRPAAPACYARDPTGASSSAGRSRTRGAGRNRPRSWRTSSS